MGFVVLYRNACAPMCLINVRPRIAPDKAPRYYNQEYNPFQRPAAERMQRARVLYVLFIIHILSHARAP